MNQTDTLIEEDNYFYMYFTSLALGLFIGTARICYEGEYMCLFAPWAGILLGIVSTITTIPYMYAAQHGLPPISVPFLATATAYAGCYLFYHGNRKYQEYKYLKERENIKR